MWNEQILAKIRLYEKRYIFEINIGIILEILRHNFKPKSQSVLSL